MQYIFIKTFYSQNIILDMELKLLVPTYNSHMMILFFIAIHLNICSSYLLQIHFKTYLSELFKHSFYFETELCPLSKIAFKIFL